MGELSLMMRLWPFTIFSFVLSLGVFTGFHSLYHARQEAYFATESRMVQSLVEDRFGLYLRGAPTVKRLAQEFWKQAQVSQAEFDAIGATILENFPEVLAANFVSPDGTISLIYPHDPNNLNVKGRISQNLQALRESFARHEELWLSQPFELFQRGQGFVYYLPLERHGKFLGWYGIVISQDRLMKVFNKGLHSVFNIEVKDKLTNLDYFCSAEIPAKPPAFLLRHEVEILGRKIIVSTWPKDPLPLHWEWPEFLALSLVFTLLSSVAWYFFLQRRQGRRQLSELNHLLELILHDTSNSMSTLRLQLEVMRTNPQLVSLSKVTQHVEFVVELMEQVKLVRELSDGQRGWPLTSGPLLPMLSKAIDMVNDRLDEKKISLIYDPEKIAGLKVTVNERLWAHSVLINLLLFCAEFSTPGSSLRIEVIDSSEGKGLRFENPLTEGKLEKADELSLAIAKRVMELHDGVLDEDLMPPVGLALRVRWP